MKMTESRVSSRFTVMVVMLVVLEPQSLPFCIFLQRLQMAATPTAQIPVSVPTSTLQAATGSPQQVLIRSPALVSTAPPHQQTTVMVSHSLPQATLQVPVGQTVPLVASPRLQPRVCVLICTKTVL